MIKCNICGSESFSKPEKLNAFLQVNGETALLYCEQCGFVFRTSLPDVDQKKKLEIETANALYDGEYTAGTTEINSRLKQRLLYFSNLCQSPDRTLLDIGAGTGTFLGAAKEMNWNILGTELSGAADDILQIDIMKDSHPVLEGKQFDLIHINHVLEHIYTPQTMLTAVDKYLKPGGYLCLEVPNEFFSLATQIKLLFGIKYNSSTAYFGHCCFFSVETLILLVHNFPSLEIISIKTPYIAQDMDFKHKIIDRIQSSLNMGAVIECVCRKKAATRHHRLRD